ncbi:calmodulin-binding protein [Planoprotostelium fungivorum]|uniref:Calmodulin-binding protein n=1 Tax=Planoprotostelium fungivorum TaxID=1890364 RepID=A0A2P6NIU0_9EUKA|nr:calmodulin-binding protein [Planoprotostelium fungivorum]
MKKRPASFNLFKSKDDGVPLSFVRIEEAIGGVISQFSPPQERHSTQTSPVTMRTSLNLSTRTEVYLSDDINLPPQIRKRNMVINEIINTERSYVEDLDIIIQIFLIPFKESKLLTDSVVYEIFSNVEALVGIHQDIAAQMEEDARKSNGSGLGDIFVKKSDHLRFYSLFCSNQKRSTNIVDKLQLQNNKVKDLLRRCESNPVCRSLPLGSFLIKPVQRICKYPLLLRELIKVTPTGSSEHAQLLEAQQKIDLVLAEVNEQTGEDENREKLLELQSRFEEGTSLVTFNRRLLKMTTLKEVTGPFRTLEKFKYLLFSDALMRAAVKITGKLAVREVILMEHLSVLRADKPTDIVFKNSANNNITIASAKTQELREEWFSAVTKAKQFSLQLQLKRRNTVAIGNHSYHPPELHVKTSQPEPETPAVRMRCQTTIGRMGQLRRATRDRKRRLSHEPPQRDDHLYQTFSCHYKDKRYVRLLSHKDKTVSLLDLNQFIEEKFGISNLIIRYKDDENDLITIVKQEDLDIAILDFRVESFFLFCEPETILKKNATLTRHRYHLHWCSEFLSSLYFCSIALSGVYNCGSALRLRGHPVKALNGFVCTNKIEIIWPVVVLSDVSASPCLTVSYSG